MKIIHVNKSSIRNFVMILLLAVVCVVGYFLKVSYDTLFLIGMNLALVIYLVGSITDIVGSMFASFMFSSGYWKGKEDDEGGDSNDQGPEA